MKIKYHKRFIKAYHKLPAKLQKVTDDRIRLFAKSPFTHEINNHALSGEYQGYRSINITGDYRAVFKNISWDIVLFVKIGKHAQLYD